MKIDGQSYIKLIGDAKAFLEAVYFIEERIRELNLEPGSQGLVGGSTGWRIHDAWESLKTASHFNFGVALELRLKCILILSSDGHTDQAKEAGHSLVKIYDLIPPKPRKELEALFTQEMNNKSIRFEMLTRRDSEPTDIPPDRKPRNLRDYCVYFDKDMRLWGKRYSWEEVSNQAWVHYIVDLSPLRSFAEKAEEIGKEMALELGIIKREPHKQRIKELRKNNKKRKPRRKR